MASAAASPNPTLKLHTGAAMPQVGLGTWQAAPGEVETAVRAALDAGYTHLDCAHCYENEAEVGAAIAASNKPRNEIFVTSKLWNTSHGKSQVAKAAAHTLKNLGLDYLDLYLIHWPIAFVATSDKELTPKTADGKGVALDTATSIIDTWREMEKLVDAGKAKAIGVSNFTASMLRELLPQCRIRPAVNQVELHVFLPQPALLEYCRKENIVVTAYSPLGSGKEPSPLKDETVVKIAKRHGKDAGQILVSWAVQRGTVVLPKSVKAERIRSNREIVTLSDEEMAELNAIKTRKRFVDPKEFWGTDIFKGDYADN
ncbi:hypothetical protein HDU86_004686 [Geranomyces michiganensis]|nr:hypothetical protein HDU86_004686 [Geranomyces michiganensis]